MIRVVFDTVIFVRALLDSRSISGRLVHEHSRDYRLFLAPSLIEEIVEVLGRKEIIERFHLRQSNYPEAMARLLKSLDSAEIVKIEKIPSVSRDINDDKFLATAKEADAQYLVSADKDLSASCKRAEKLCLLDLKDYQGIKIIDAETFLQILEEDKLI